jgi:DNA-directed RNA polymerase specialized sigma24 family protein
VSRSKGTISRDLQILEAYEAGASTSLLSDMFNLAVHECHARIYRARKKRDER